MEFMKNDHHQETTSSSPSSVAVADHRPKTYTVMTSTGKPLKIRFVFGKSSKNKPAADEVPTQDNDQKHVLEAGEKMEINAKDIISNRQQQQQIIQEKDHKKAGATTTKDHHQEAAKQVKDHQTTMITVKKSFRTPDDQYYSAPPSSNQIKLEASKRKLHESYKQLADAKKQKMIKVIEHLPPKKSSSSPRGASSSNSKYQHFESTRSRDQKVLIKEELTPWATKTYVTNLLINVDATEG